MNVGVVCMTGVRCDCCGAGGGLELSDLRRCHHL